MVMTGHAGGIPCVIFHAGGQELVTGGKDDKVRFWEPSAGRLIRNISLEEAPQALAFSADGKMLAVGVMGRLNAKHLKLIDAHSNKVLYETDLGIGQMHSLALGNRTNGRYLAASGSGGIGLWRIKNAAPLEMEEVVKLKRSRCLATAT